MDVLVMLEENAEHSAVLAHVNSVPAPLHSERPPREIVTLYGAPSSESLALALAAAVEGQRTSIAGGGGSSAIRHLGVWAERGAVGDAAWRDNAGTLHTRDLEIPLDVLGITAGQLLSECGAVIQRLVAGLAMPDWPEGSRRAISFSLTPAFSGGAGTAEALETFRQSGGLSFDDGSEDEAN